jgi:hypothetical protein
MGLDLIARSASTAVRWSGPRATTVKGERTDTESGPSYTTSLGVNLI